MLVNHLGTTVKVSDKLNSTSNPRIFANLREIHEPSPKYVGTMYNMENRAKITQLR